MVQHLQCADLRQRHNHGLRLRLYTTIRQGTVLIRHADDLIYLACALVVVALLLLFHQVLVAKLGCVSHGWCFRSIP